MILYSWNVNGYNSCTNKGDLQALFELCPEFICLQELKVSDTFSLTTLFNYEYLCFANISKNKGRNGVAVFTKLEPKKIINAIGDNIFDSDGRYIELCYDNFSIINVYIPHGDRDKSKLAYKLEAFELLTQYLAKRTGENIILVGDFNVARSEIDALNAHRNANNTMFTLEERTAMDELINIGLVDSFRKLNNTTKAYTWWPYAYKARERNIGWRIDYIFLSRELSNIRYSVSICDQFLGSDHCPISIEFESDLMRMK